MLEAWVRSLGRKDPLEEETATHSSILAWYIPWTREPGGLLGAMRPWGRRVRQDLATEHAVLLWNFGVCVCVFPLFLIYF